MNACSFEAFRVLFKLNNVTLQGETGLVATWLKVHSVKFEYGSPGPCYPCEILVKI